MLQLFDYQIYIFDCDGVILDSNQLKIQAMRTVLQEMDYDFVTVEQCILYFSENFGKSRFHHIEFFINNIINIDNENTAFVKEFILSRFSEKCRELYMSASISPGFVEFIMSLDGKKYIASGSEQIELRDVFEKRDLSYLFDGIYGSPTDKSELLANIINSNNSNNAVMFGDAVSDFEAAQMNDIDFVFYAPFSNVKDPMLKLSEKYSFPVLNSFL